MCIYICVCVLQRVYPVLYLIIKKILCVCSAAIHYGRSALSFLRGRNREELSSNRPHCSRAVVRLDYRFRRATRPRVPARRRCRLCIVAHRAGYRRRLQRSLRPDLIELPAAVNLLCSEKGDGPRAAP